MTRFYFLAALTLLLLGSRYAAADMVDAHIGDALKKNHVPGAVIMVLRDGKVLKQRAYGVANVELQVPSKLNDVYPLASATKIFTATAVLLLVQDGKVGLDEPIGQILPSLPENWRKLTVRQCLSHSTGLPNAFAGSSLTPIAWEQDQLIQKLEALPFEYETGTRSRYQQTDYLLLRMAIEHITSETLADFIKQRIFDPLKMASARYGDYHDVIPGRVSFYWHYAPAADRMDILWQKGRPILSPDRIWNHPITYAVYDSGGVGLNMSAEDLAKFDTALWQGKILNHSLVEQMVKPFVLANGQAGPFALGWELGSPGKGDRIVYHDGAGAIIYARDLDTHTTLIVFTNCNGDQPPAIMRELLRQFSPTAQFD